MKNIRSFLKFGLVVWILLFFSCKKFLEIDLPEDQINSTEVYKADETATAAVRAIYVQMMSGGGFASGNSVSVTFCAGRSADDFVNFSTTTENIQYSDNNVLDLNVSMTSSLWQQPYQTIYYANSVLENLEKSNLISLAVKKQLSGEAKLIRAFCYFYLTNLFGEIPLALTTDYRINSVLHASTKDQIYTQIIMDLKDAKDLLSENYPYTERIRPNKFAAAAFLARVYLFNGDWANAEIQAAEVIAKEDQYKLMDDLDQVFVRTSKEAILQFALPTTILLNTWEGNKFILTSAVATNETEVKLSPDFLNAFEPGDQRLSKWVGTYTSGADVLKYPFKYKIKNGITSLNEYSVVLRLAEQYLIRAEARIHLNRIKLGIEDLNLIRARARALPTIDVPDPLPNLSESLSKADALIAVEKERRIELFSEWGHRWLDLKRTNRADLVLSPIKGSNWQSTDVLYPIPASELLNNPNLK